MRKLTPALVTALILATGLAQADTLIDTYTAWLAGGGTETIVPFGNQGTATYGQVFTAPVSDSVLDSFSFWLQPTGPASVGFTAYLAAWNEAAGVAIGPMLYTSAHQSLTGGTSAFSEYQFSPPGGIGLTPGQLYVAFLNDSADWGVGGQAGIAAIFYGDAADPNRGTYFVFDNNADDFGSLTATRWSSMGAYGKAADAAFQADFGPGPETGSTPELPAGSLTLLGLAPIGLRWMRRRRP